MFARATRTIHTRTTTSIIGTRGIESPKILFRILRLMSSHWFDGSVFSFWNVLSTRVPRVAEQSSEHLEDSQVYAYGPSVYPQ